MDNALNKADLVAEVIRGLIYSHNRANANTTEIHQACATIHAMAELLIERGVLERETLQVRRKEVGERLRSEYLERGMSVAMQEFHISKYEFKQDSKINCAGRVHLCKAACCRLPLALSQEDVKEGIVHWDLGQPYILSRDKDGYCVHLDRDTHRCTIYEHRPIPCRGYQCGKDKRIWLDFEAKFINHRIHDPDWLAGLEAEEDQTKNRELDDQSS